MTPISEKKTALRYFSRLVKTQILGTKPQKQVKRKEEEKSNLNLVCIGNISYTEIKLLIFEFMTSSFLVSHQMHRYYYIISFEIPAIFYQIFM